MCYPGYYRKGKPSKEIDAYINGFPQAVQKALKQIRRTIRKAAPLADEKISYGIPTYFLNGNLVHFAAFSRHISYFPTGSGVRAFKRELTKYKTAPGTIQFPFGESLPLSLVSRIVKFRVKENMKKRAKRGGSKRT